ncbi:hypothetical protein Taro_031411 [Colocasia esculenta]|uniref:Uncharacterized protein n=1 Tax=Colocasia esculenta TaxID=4460 RepID=A0A843W322_COLES|nr:hypothetical protein [Colocasia esculenta]
MLFTRPPDCPGRRGIAAGRPDWSAARAPHVELRVGPAQSTNQVGPRCFHVGLGNRGGRADSISHIQDAACRRVLLQSGQGSRAGADLDAVLRGLGSYQGGAAHLRRHVSQLLPKSNGKPAFLVDTLALVSGSRQSGNNCRAGLGGWTPGVRRLEAQGIPSKQAEAITSAITEVLNDSLENVAQSFVSQGELQKDFGGTLHRGLVNLSPYEVMSLLYSGICIEADRIVWWLVLHAMLWVVWGERNHWIFRRESQPEQVLAQFIWDRVKEWALALSNMARELGSRKVHEPL